MFCTVVFIHKKCMDSKNKLDVHALVFSFLKLFSFEMGGQPIVVASGYEMVHELWITQGNKTSLRSPHTMTKFIEERNSQYPGTVDFILGGGLYVSLFTLWWLYWDQLSSMVCTHRQ